MEEELLQDEPVPVSASRPTNTEMMKIITSLSQNMAVMSESLKRLHDERDEAESAVQKKSRQSPESGINNEVDELLSEGDNSAETVEEPEDIDVLDDIAQSLDEAEKTDEPVADKLANIATKTWQHLLPEDQLKEKAGKYHRPSNCDKLCTAPKVNEEIWSKLPREPRGKDLKFSRLQTSISKAAYIAVKSTDMLLKLKGKVGHDLSKDLNSLVVMTTDSLQLLGHASAELSQVRKDEIKPHLHKDYADLCSANLPVTKLLFGDDLQMQLTNIRAANKIGNTASKSFANKRPSQTYHSRYNNKNFLGRATSALQGRQNYKNKYSTYNRTKRADQQTKK